MTYLPEPADLTERRAQEQAHRTMAAIEEISVEYGDVREMPSIPKAVPCRRDGADPRLWDAPSVDDAPESRAKESFLQIVARTLCAGCPVLDECLAWALNNDEPEGIWGGTTPTERMNIRTSDRSASA
jgi:WhiB family redox-sensing transcriptional regulator